MKTIAILQLLLTVVSCRSQREDEQRYYIYNVTAYYCIHKSDAFHCTKFNKFVKDNDGNYMIFNTKTSNSYSEIKNLYKDIAQVNITFCKSLEKTDVTKNTLTIYLNENFCRYTYEKLRNGNFEIWTTDTCLDSYQAKKQKSRRDELKNTCKNFTLPVQKKLNLANGDVCKATESLINYTIKYYGIIDEGYNKASDMKQVTSDMVAIPKTWYIYKYILSFAVYYDISRLNKSCTPVEKNEQLLYECKCKLTSNFNKACKEIIKYNLRSSITKPTSFSDVKKFLNSLDTCGYMQKWDEGYKNCDRAKCVIVTSSVLGNLTLKKKAKLCNETIWVTDSDGFVVSERKLQYIYEPDFDSLVKYDNTEDDSKKDVSRQEDKINEVQKLLFYISILLVICVLWYIFNTVVNFYSLWKIGQRRRIKNKLYFMNCLSRSLTSRYIYFNLTDNFNNETLKMTNEGLYEYIEE